MRVVIPNWWLWLHRRTRIKFGTQGYQLTELRYLLHHERVGRIRRHPHTDRRKHCTIRLLIALAHPACMRDQLHQLQIKKQKYWHDWDLDGLDRYISIFLAPFNYFTTLSILAMPLPILSIQGLFEFEHFWARPLFLMRLTMTYLWCPMRWR